MNANEERERVAALRSGAAGFRPTKWRTHKALVQALFSILTALGVLAFYLLCDEIGPRPGIVSGVVAIAAAEWLIRVRRWFGTGVEGALWLAGLFALIEELPSSNQPESMLVVAAACAIAGWRVRNPIFGAGAAVAVASYFEWKRDLGVVASLVIAAGAMLLLLRTWRRPSTEWLLTTIAIALPAAGLWMANSQWLETTFVLYTAFAAFAFLLGIARRHHAMLLGGIVASVVAGERLTRILDLRVEWMLLTKGVLLLAIAFAVTRELRGRTTGIVITPEPLTPADEALQIGATLVTQPQPQAPGERPDGRFGGAGASGGY